MLTRGMDKLSKDLDIVRLVQIVNSFDTLKRVVFDKDKRLLL